MNVWWKVELKINPLSVFRNCVEFKLPNTFSGESCILLLCFHSFFLSFWWDYPCVCVCVWENTLSLRAGGGVSMSHSLSLSPSFSSRSVLAVFPPSHFSLSLFVSLSLSLSSARPCGTSDEEFHPSTSPVSYLSFPLHRSFAFHTVPRAPLALQGGDLLETSLESVRGEKRGKKKPGFFFLPRGPPD